MKVDSARTSDGIPLSDWEAIKELSAKCANAVSDNFEDKKFSDLRKKMLRRLNRLSIKYGEKPSIFATKADYVISNKNRENLLKSAFYLAEKMHDYKNMTLISSSLAEFYVEDIGDLENGKKWLDCLGVSLSKYPDQMEQRVYERIKNIIDLQSMDN